MAHLYRLALVALAVVLASSGCGGEVAPKSSETTSPTAQAIHASQRFRRLEHRFHAHLGVYVADTGDGRTLTYHADERFAYASTYKVLAVGVLLRRASDRALNHVVTYRKSDLQDYSPITAKHVAGGMTLRALLAAALRYSDNTAANLLLRRLGGAKRLEKALRGLGDETTHVDRNEPAVNEALPGDPRDTSTPRALGGDLRRFVLGRLLPDRRRKLLTSWLVTNTTGVHYIRAGVPAGWKVGDKTGNGGYGTRNDIAIAWPARGAPFVIAIQSRRTSVNAKSDDALIADATRVALTALR